MPVSPARFRPVKFHRSRLNIHTAPLTNLCHDCRLACSAFVAVFRRRQTKHQQLLHWAQEQVLGLRVKGQERRLLGRATGR